MSDAFNASLPPPYADGWKKAERSSPDDSPRLTSYQAPGGNAVGFILKEFKFSGGQSVDTAEYPFFGLWSNEALNEKPQALHVNGFIRGGGYIQTRNDFIEALRIKTSDDAPGFIDFPFWGRFPIVVMDYEIAENTDEKGQCAVSLVFKRAGVSITERVNALPYLNDAIEAAAGNLEAAAIDSFERKLADTVDTVTLAQGFGKIKTELLRVLGRVRAAETALNNISNEINGISSLLSQGVRAPGQLARSLFSAVASIVAGLEELRNSAASYTDKSVYPAPAHNNEKNVLTHFLSASTYTPDITALTVRQENTKRAMENLYRVSAFGAASLIMTQLDDSRQKVQGYWNLYRKLEASVDKNDPAIHAGIEAARIGVSQALSHKDLAAEKKRRFNVQLPLLYIAHYLGCGEAKLRELNSIADSFVLQGEMIYV